MIITKYEIFITKLFNLKLIMKILHNIKENILQAKEPMNNKINQLYEDRCVEQYKKHDKKWAIEILDMWKTLPSERKLALDIYKTL